MPRRADAIIEKCALEPATPEQIQCSSTHLTGTGRGRKDLTSTTGWRPTGEHAPAAPTAEPVAEGAPGRSPRPPGQGPSRHRRALRPRQDAALYDRPIPERHRDRLLPRSPRGLRLEPARRGAFGCPVHAELDRLFAFGIDPVDGELPSRRARGLAGARRRSRGYATRAARRARRVPRARELWRTRGAGASGALLHVAIEHRLMHAETLAYMLHQPAADRKMRPARDRPQPGARRAACRPSGRESRAAWPRSGSRGRRQSSAGTTSSTRTRSTCRPSRSTPTR